MNTIYEGLNKRSAMTLQDDYDYWLSTNFIKWGGKLMIIDANDFNTHHIFFDDHAKQ